MLLQLKHYFHQQSSVDVNAHGDGALLKQRPFQIFMRPKLVPIVTKWVQMSPLRYSSDIVSALGKPTFHVTFALVHFCFLSFKLQISNTAPSE